MEGILKIAVDVVPETSEMLQKIAFQNGYSWIYGGRNITALGSPRLFFTRRGKTEKIITHVFKRTGLCGITLVDVNEAIEFIKQKDEPILKAGDYIMVGSSRVYLITEINETGVAAKSVKCKGDDTPESEFMKWSYDRFISDVYSRHATEEEIKEALRLEWERRLGGRDRVRCRNLTRRFLLYTRPTDWGFNPLDSDAVVYDVADDEFYCNKICVYKQGKWTEIEDAPEEVGGYKVESNRRCLIIGGQIYSNDRIKSAIGLPRLKKLVFEDCSGNEIEITEKEARRLYNKFFGDD
jgi:hypothetical protein